MSPFFWEAAVLLFGADDATDARWPGEGLGPVTLALPPPLLLLLALLTASGAATSVEGNEGLS